MVDHQVEETAERIQKLARDYLADMARQASQAQSQFLASRQDTLRQIGDLVRVNAGLTPDNLVSEKPVLFSRSMLEEFASGSIEKCFGSEFAVYNHRRAPRIPNGALLLMDRILEVKGNQGRLSQPAEITTEYDVQQDAWFIQDSGSEVTPYSILMEMALQPCGFLSAYLGTMLLAPNSNLYFRNLDGEAKIHQEVDLRGKTVRGWARMVNHTVNEETVIQKFDFRLETGGETFYDGFSVFGFFPEETMLRQIGLDNGKESLPKYLKGETTNLLGKVIDMQAGESPETFNQGLNRSTGRLALLDQIYINPTGGTKGLGYLYASRKIDPDAWFFTNHFYQDPVMPGSLGVEAILETMRVFAIEMGLSADIRSPRFSWDQSTFQWKYRGQILKTTKTMHLEVDIRSIEKTQNEVVISGDANLWADGTRIYTVKNAAIRIAQG